MGSTPFHPWLIRFSSPMFIISIALYQKVFSTKTPLFISGIGTKHLQWDNIWPQRHIGDKKNRNYNLPKSFSRLLIQRGNGPRREKLFDTPLGHSHPLTGLKRPESSGSLVSDCVASLVIRTPLVRECWVDEVSMKAQERRRRRPWVTGPYQIAVLYV